MVQHSCRTVSCSKLQVFLSLIPIHPLAPPLLTGRRLSSVTFTVSLWLSKAPSFRRDSAASRAPDRLSSAASLSGLLRPLKSMTRHRSSGAYCLIQACGSFCVLLMVTRPTHCACKMLLSSALTHSSLQTILWSSVTAAWCSSTDSTPLCSRGHTWSDCAAAAAGAGGGAAAAAGGSVCRAARAERQRQSHATAIRAGPAPAAVTHCQKVLPAAERNSSRPRSKAHHTCFVGWCGLLPLHRPLLRH